MIAEDNSFTIEEMNMDKDYVHLLVNCSPQNYIPSMMKALKGVSAHKLFKQMPELKKTEAQIRKYIQSQKVVNV